MVVYVFGGTSKKQLRLVEALSWSGDTFPTIVRLILSLCGQTYQTDILESAGIPHFDNRSLLIRQIFMDGNARSHRSRAVIESSRQNAVSTIPLPAHSPDLNPFEHLWDFLGRKVRAKNPQHRISPNLKLLCIESGVRYPNFKFNVWPRV